MRPLITFTELRFGAGSRFWAFRQMGTFGAATARVPGLRFRRLLGCGRRFAGVLPDFTRYALLGVWESEEAQRRFWSSDRVMLEHRRRARSVVTWRLETLRSRGTWGGHEIFGEPAAATPGASIAVLTHARLRPSRQLSFWKMAEAIEPEIDGAPGLLSSTAIGEWPVLRSGTFSAWERAEAIAAFVRAPAHAEAQRARATMGLYEEEIFARFTVLATEREDS